MEGAEKRRAPATTCASLTGGARQGCGARRACVSETVFSWKVILCVIGARAAEEEAEQQLNGCRAGRMLWRGSGNGTRMRVWHGLVCLLCCTCVVVGGGGRDVHSDKSLGQGPNLSGS